MYKLLLNFSRQGENSQRHKETPEEAEAENSVLISERQAHSTVFKLSVDTRSYFCQRNRWDGMRRRYLAVQQKDERVSAGCNSSKEAKHGRTEKVWTSTWPSVRLQQEKKNMLNKQQSRRKNKPIPALPIKNQELGSAISSCSSCYSRNCSSKLLEELGEVTHVNTNKWRSIANNILMQYWWLFLFSLLPLSFVYL